MIYVHTKELFSFLVNWRIYLFFCKNCGIYTVIFADVLLSNVELYWSSAVTSIMLLYIGSINIFGFYNFLLRCVALHCIALYCIRYRKKGVLKVESFVNACSNYSGYLNHVARQGEVTSTVLFFLYVEELFLNWWSHTENFVIRLYYGAV